MNNKKLEVLNRLVQGDSVTDISRELDISRQTVYNYIQQEEFKEVRNKLETEMYDTLFHVGVSEMKEILITGNNYQKIQVFQLLSKLQNRVVDNSKVTVSVDDILKDLI